MHYIKNSKSSLLESKIRRIIRTVLSENNLNKESTNTLDELIIEKTLSIILKTIGLDLKLDDHFGGLKNTKKGKYFNIILKEKTSESKEYDQLERFSEKYKLINIEPNGVRRVAIFPTLKLLQK